MAVAARSGLVAVALLPMRERRRRCGLPERREVLPAKLSRDECEDMDMPDGGVIGMDGRQKLDGGA